MHAHCLGLFALSSLCVLATSLFSLATKRIPALHVSLREFVSKQRYHLLEATHSRTLHTRPRLHRGRGRLNHTHHALPFSLKVYVWMWCVSQCSECEEGQCCLSYFLTSLFFRCSALTNLFVHVPQSYFPILPILSSLTCACIFVSTGYWKLIRETLFWTGDQCPATWRNGLNLTHHALPFSLTL